MTQQIQQYIRQTAQEYIDPLTGELNTTWLLEDAVDRFDVEVDSELYHQIDDWTVELAIEIEQADPYMAEYLAFEDIPTGL